MRKKIDYPPFVFGGIRANHRAIPLEKNLRIFGTDTETMQGEPHTLQMYNGKDLLFEYVSPKTIFKLFSGYLFDHSASHGVNIAYNHYLRFDTPIYFYKKRLAIYEQISEIKFDFEGIECEILFGKINKITMRRKDRVVHVFDSWSFTQASLARSLNMFKIDGAKMEKSEALQKAIGVTDFKALPKSSPLRLEFEAYAKNDPIVEYKLGLGIMGFHDKYKVRPSISLPQFAARVFRHHFFEREEVINFPPAEAVTAAELSYHGGKNGYYLDVPQKIEDAYEVDISSAYPFAMKQIPQMVKGAYAHVKAYKPGRVGIYKVSGEDRGRYPIVYDHDFKPVRGSFTDLWITSFELERAMSSKDCRVEVLDGWTWLADPSYKHNPMAEYVDHFYKLKETTHKDDPNYYFYKIMLNGLYGKFVQTTEIRRLIELDKRHLTEDGKKRKIAVDYSWDDVLQKFIKVQNSHRAGGLYNPFIASLITGYVRAMLYDLEVKYEAIHSATDAVKTTVKPQALKGLGGYKIETFGRCYIFRNKLYLHFGKSNQYCGHDLSKIKIFDTDGQHLCKYGLHGFKGEARDLFNARNSLLAGEEYKYEYEHMIGLREGFKRREKICSMTTRREVIKL